MPAAPDPSRHDRLQDALLLSMVVIWGANYSLVKATLEVLSPSGFNALRLAVASAIYLAVLTWAGRRGYRVADAEAGHVGGRDGTLSRALGTSTPSPSDWGRILLTALVGHALYQVAFIQGMARTTAANAALLIGCSPMTVSIATAVAGHERLAARHWLGLALSFCGVYLVVGRAASLDRSALIGDVLILAAVACWAVYTVLTRTLLDRHSPLFLTTWSMSIGTLVYGLVVWRDLVAEPWAEVPAWAWAATAVSGAFALNLAYLIYYVAVRRIGAARTSVWSNLVPIVGAAFAWLLLGERLDAWQVGGAALILGGIAFTRAAARPTGARDDLAPAD